MTEIFAGRRQPAELLFLGDVFEFFLELLDRDAAAGGGRRRGVRGRLRKHDQIVTGMIDADRAVMHCSIRDHRACHVQVLDGHVGVLCQHCKD